MGQEVLSTFHLERKRLLSLIGITFAVILAFQYFELPYSNILVPSLFSTKKIPITNNTSIIQATDSLSPPQIYNNITILNHTNSEHYLNENDTISSTDFISKPARVLNNSLGSHESDQPRSSDNSAIGMNLTREVNTGVIDSLSHAIAPTSPSTKLLSNDLENIDSMNDERFKPLQDDVNVMDKQSSTTSVLKKTKDSLITVPQTTSISEMEKLLLQYHASYRSMRPRWSSAVDQELLQARSEIENAPVVTDVENLHAPLFRNVSMFKRSYELMEKTLKVYVYREGTKPIMHSPYLLGIYASEGWFMKLMETNKAFVTKDPKKAHLFYLPFSSRTLEETLYDRNSHSHKNLMRYLNNYVDMIAAKHNFWNRTGGADHFLVACHDWAPSETKQRMAKCLRSLCNADVKEGFVLGKDVSLPETYVRNAKNPTRDLGGNQVSKRKTLAFYAGGMHGYVRPILLQHWENKDPDMKIFGMMPKSKGNRNYIQYMKRSKYCVCPKGYEVNSPRVVEAIVYECVPVIISDNFVPPFFEVLNWESFAVFVLEKDIPNLKSILVSIPEKKYLQMQMRVKKVQQHFLWHRSPVKYDIFHMILHSIWYNRVFTARTR